jgi:hypothetical protein
MSADSKYELLVVPVSRYSDKDSSSGFFLARHNESLSCEKKISVIRLDREDTSLRLKIDVLLKLK